MSQEPSLTEESPPRQKLSDGGGSSSAPGGAARGSGRIGAILEQLPAPTLVVEGPELTITVANAAYRRLVGNRELVGRTFGDALPEIAGQGFEARLRDVYETGKPMRGERVPARWDRDGRGEIVEGVVDFVFEPVPALEGGRRGVVVQVVDRSERARVEAVLASISDAFYALDRRWRFVYLNARAEQILGRSRDDLFGKNIWEEFAPAVGSPFETYYRRALDTSEPQTFEAPYEPLGGWFEVRAYPGPEGLAVYFQDVTARRAERLALAESERHLRTLVDAIPALAWTARADGFIDWYNARWYGYTGMTPKQMEGWGWQSVHDPAVLPLVMERWTRSIETGAPFEMTFPLRGADGIFRHFLTRVVPVRDAEGRVVRWFGTNTDVTAEREALASAERAAQRTQRLQSLTAALASTQTIDDVATVVVAQSVETLGAASGMLAVREPVGDDAIIVRHAGLARMAPPDRARLSAIGPGPTAECLRTGEPQWLENRAELDARFPETRAIWEQTGVQALASVPLTLGDDTLGVMTYAFAEPRTISPNERGFLLALGAQCAQAIDRARLLAAEREARTAAETARAAAERAASAKSDFLATMSHEIRTPINAIVGYTQLLELGLPDPATAGQREQLARIAASAQHLLGLVNDVLDMAKIDAKQMRVTHEHATTEPVVEAALAITRPMADERGVRIVGNHVGAADSHFVGDPARVRQILLNLLSNAVKFTPPNGTITIDSGTVERVPPMVRATGRGPWTYIRVADTGRGIARSQHTSIFEPFVQAESGRTRTTGGTGLGLTISRRLARLMGGDLTLESELGSGATFTLWLPSGIERADGEGGADGAAPGRVTWRAHGLDEIGIALRAESEAIVADYAVRLRTDPVTTIARAMQQSEIEDHAITLLADLSQSLVMIHEAGDRAAELMRDSSIIQRTIAEAHGTRRYAQGWSEAALTRDNEILFETLQHAVRDRVRAGEDDVSEGLRVLTHLTARAGAQSLAAYRRAAEGGAGRGG